LTGFTTDLLPKVKNSRDVALVEELARCEARQFFYNFRCHIREKDLVRGWWIKEVCDHLEAFYYRFMNGERPKLVLMAPPQHGKTTVVTDFIAWVAGRNPNLKCLFTSYSDDLGQGVNVSLQRMMDGDRFKSVFGARLPTFGRSVGGMRNNNLLEYMGEHTPTNPTVQGAFKGSFRNTTVSGQVTGKGLDFGFIDDPIKGRREANSKTVRDATWSWLTDDFFTRFSDHAALLMTLTRWHLDDPAGRFLEKFPETVVLDYPAIAIKDEAHRKKGEALFPEFKSLEFLEERRRGLSQASWVSLYQQNPIIAGGGMFPIEQFRVVQAAPKDIAKTVRYWDKAATEMGGAYTAGVRMSKLNDGRFIVTDVRRKQLSALDREKMILQTAQLDRQDVGNNVLTVVEQEPGSGGKDSAEATVRMLSGYKVEADKVTDAKHIRADPYAAQVQAGNVSILAAEWNKEFIGEHETFPNGAYVDMVDAAAGAFSKLTLGSTYRSDMSWVGDVPSNILAQKVFGGARLW
jgi:predicted phage terminase large subunit-like protein